MKNLLFILLLGIMGLPVSAQAISVSILEKNEATPRKLNQAINCFSTNLILVRHAEKMTGSTDPKLTEAGKARAAKLAALFDNMWISEIYSTDYNRTKETAQPLASLKNLQTKIYPAKESAETVKNLKLSRKNSVIIGHSNTLHQMLNALTNENTFEEIPETDYTHLFVVNIKKRRVKIHHFKY